ncbi:MAG TPA: GNAT family N-acetyltransferase [bacterium]|nr:GNAT family N-acetyltransferase [bacterium]
MLAIQKEKLAKQWSVSIATPYHVVYAQAISEMITEALQEPGIALAARSPEYVAGVMQQGHAALAINGLGEVVGFSSIKLWDDGKFISNCGLIVPKAYRKQGIGSAIVVSLWELAVDKYPGATVFSLTDAPMVKKTRKAMGFAEMPFSAVTQDPHFWAGCRTCPQYTTYLANNGQKCSCIVLAKTTVHNQLLG